MAINARARLEGVEPREGFDFGMRLQPHHPVRPFALFLVVDAAQVAQGLVYFVDVVVEIAQRQD
jgi:hypothetical protein